MNFRYIDAVKALAVVLLLFAHFADGTLRNLADDASEVAVAHGVPVDGRWTPVEEIRADWRARHGRAPDDLSAPQWRPSPRDYGWPLVWRQIVAVPVVASFLLASGALLLNVRPPAPGRPAPRPPSWPAWYRHRFGKLLPAFVFWSYGFIGFRILAGWDLPIRWRDWLLLPPGTFYHLWFMYMLFALYALTPPLLWWRARVPRGAQWAVAGLGAAMGSFALAVPVFGALQPWTEPLKPFRMAFLLAGLFALYLAGGLLHSAPAPRRGGPWLALGLGALGASIACLFGWYALQTGPIKGFPNFFGAPSGPFAMATAVGLFQFFRWKMDPARRAANAATGAAANPARPVDGRFWRFTVWLSRGTLGLYFLHILPTWALVEWMHTAAPTWAVSGLSAWWGCPAGGLAIASVTLGGVWLLQRIPGSSYVLP